MIDPYAAREKVKGLSGLFPGPVIDGGRRMWDWNPNSRVASEQRWYAGLWDVTIWDCAIPRSLIPGG